MSSKKQLSKLPQSLSSASILGGVIHQTSWKAQPKADKQVGIKLVDEYVMRALKEHITLRDRLLAYFEPKQGKYIGIPAIEECIKGVNERYQQNREDWKLKATEAAKVKAEADKLTPEQAVDLSQKMLADAEDQFSATTGSRKSELVGILDAAKHDIKKTVSILRSNGYQPAKKMLRDMLVKAGIKKPRKQRAGVVPGPKQASAAEVEAARKETQTLLKKSDDAFTKLVKDAEDSVCYSGLVAIIQRLKGGKKGDRFTELGEILWDAYQVWAAGEPEQSKAPEPQVSNGIEAQRKRSAAAKAAAATRKRNRQQQQQAAA